MARTGKCGKENLPGKLSIVQNSSGKGKQGGTDSLGQEKGGDVLRKPLHSLDSLILGWGCGSCHGMELVPGILGLLEQDPFLEASTEVFGCRATPSVPAPVKAAD